MLQNYPFFENRFDVDLGWRVLCLYAADRAFAEHLD